MKLSELGKSFFENIVLGNDIDYVIEEFSYSERLMIAVDLHILKEHILSGIKEIIDTVEDDDIIDLNYKYQS